MVTVTVVIGGAYCSYCDSGDRFAYLVTVIVLLVGAYSIYCDSGDRGSLL